MPIALLALQLLVGCRDEAAPGTPSTQASSCEEPCAPMQAWPFPPSIDPFHHGFDVDDGRLVVRSRSYVHVHDATTTPPAWQGAVDVGFGWDVALDGDMAYATTDYGVAVLDLTDPFAPVRRGDALWVQDGRSFEAVVVADGPRAWVLEPFTGGLWGVDASDPTKPEVVVELQVDAFAMERAGDVLWLTGGSEVRGLDLRTTPPQEVARLEAPGAIDRFGIEGDVLLASFWLPGSDPAEGGFVRWDLADLGAPGHVDAVAKGSCGEGRLVLADDRAWLPCPDLHTYDRSTASFRPSDLLDGVEAPSSLALARDGDRVHAMPVANGLVEQAPWVSWSTDGTDVAAADLRPDAIGGSQLGMPAVDGRLYLRVSGRTLVLEADPMGGPRVVGRWEADVMHGHDGVLLTPEGLLSDDGTPLGVPLPEVDGDWRGSGPTAVGVRDLTLVEVAFDRDGATVVSERPLLLDDDCGGSAFCHASVAAVDEAHAVVRVIVSGFVDGAYESSERLLLVDRTTGDQGPLPLAGDVALGSGYLYGSDGPDLVVLDLSTTEEVARLTGFALGATTVADGWLVGRTRPGIQLVDLEDPAQPHPTCLHEDTLAGLVAGQVVDGVWFGPHYAGVDRVALGCP